MHVYDDYDSDENRIPLFVRCNKFTMQLCNIGFVDSTRLSIDNQFIFKQNGNFNIGVLKLQLHWKHILRQERLVAYFFFHQQLLFWFCHTLSMKNSACLLHILMPVIVRSLQAFADVYWYNSFNLMSELQSHGPTIEP